MQDPQEFEYSWCHTDYKSGEKIGNHSTSRPDYMFEEPYASAVRARFEQLGIPFPEKELVYRGAGHDMVFVKSHGVVVRVGPLNVEEGIHPWQLQPIGWLQEEGIRLPVDKRLPRVKEASHLSKDLPLTIAIYPGIRQKYKPYLDPSSKVADQMKISLWRSMFYDEYYFDRVGIIENRGWVHVLEGKKEVAAEVFLDADSERDFPQLELAKGLHDTEKKLSQIFNNKADKMYAALQRVYRRFKNKDVYFKAFEAHQPLRRMFWDAFKDEKNPNSRKLKEFWQTCKQVTNNPQYEVEIPVWKYKRASMAAGEQYVQRHIVVPQLVLYRPWTDTLEDKEIVKPIPKEVRKAVREAHRRETYRTSKERLIIPS